MGPTSRQMLRDWPELIAALLPVVLHPRKVMGIIEILRRRENAGTPERRNAGQPAAA